MKKEDLEKLLSNDSGDFELYPIDRYLHAVATERQVPDLAIAVCTIRIEEAAPALRAVLERAANGQPLSDDEEMLLFRGVYILGGARDTQACQPLLRLLRRPGKEAERLLGDATTETLSRIIVGVFDGDADALFGIIADRSADEFIRDAAFGAVTFLTWEGRIERDRTRDFVERFYRERLADDWDYAWVGWLQAIAMLALRDLVPLVYTAWDEGRIPEDALERSDFESDLREAEQQPGDIGRFDRASLSYIEDVLVALDWTRGLDDDDGIELGDDDFDLAEDEASWLDRALSSVTPATNPWRDVGRNDPCPCGSGKKFKKCCLANAE
ncbi:DUF1186 domain-containing protein [Mesorhizobium sp. WSM4303]|uniref:DUF1186 domain-containing protein n=1 Tax=unclassified Mesorhizobium TaxID=325217 RepID=UPI00115DD3E0|nr:MULTISPECIES: DUF1186 domain-containing protein [unclassified Mesorhizobium]TRC92808.1 DUF1186 domain-containing protein [Mesorhizobium sp. WSM4306]TRD01309.1 DUF1186 domain-containing protein [Mesorhizobium sp. WSM4303]